ncbi:ABC transporter permease [Aquihabitans sp. G128]|uniref:ABC transporter permease n=1 Tax=Aquihabitans sp. G128 TaxID=2849779 RepID=UPI001C23446C|nr:ABC transporter permease [Aquihabitans sp. G128]QXC60860.1 ABC transporter permease [Aquihabitans sp. G128]
MIALVRTEFTKSLRRPRTLLLVLFLVGLPVLIVAGFGSGPPRPRDVGDDVGTFRLIRDSGVVAGPALLRRLATFLLVVLAGWFAGDTVASDASWGNLRYLLIRPVSRVRLLLAKTTVAFTMIFASVLLVTYAAAGAGAVKFGVAPIHVDGVPAALNAGIEIPTFDLTVAEQWLRCGLVALYVTLGFGAVLGLGVLFSTVADQPTGAVAGAIGAYIASGIFDGIAIFGSARNALPTHYAEAWRACFIEDRWFTADIGRSLLVNAAWFAVAITAALWWFRRKDIHS